jgi:S-adenosyl-L-methionine methyltransferase
LTPSNQPLTRLDKAIRRLKAQRTCLDWAAGEIAGIPGVILELGLGNGRSFDHLRARLPDRDIFVFERNPQAHPSSTPADDRLIIGNLEETLPAVRERFAGKAAFVHSDIGTGDDERNRRFAEWLGPHILALLAPGAIVASDQMLPALAELKIPPPEGVGEDRYYLYRPSGG